MKITAIVLMVLGLATLIWQGFSYNKKEEVMSFGDFEASFTHKERVAIHPVIGGLVLAAGVGLFFYDHNRRSKG